MSAEGEPSAARPAEPLGPLSEASVLKVEALFSGEPAAPAREAGPSLLRIRLLLGLALPFNLLGIPCGIGVPGGILTLWAYLLSDAELVRVEDGLYSDEDAGAFQRFQSFGIGQGNEVDPDHPADQPPETVLRMAVVLARLQGGVARQATEDQQARSRVDDRVEGALQGHAAPNTRANTVSTCLVW